MSTTVFDIETNGLFPDLNKLWCVTAHSVEEAAARFYGPNDMGWQAQLRNSKKLVGHNIIAYDLPALEHLKGWKPEPNTKIIDTVILSRVLDYRRFGQDGHSLKRWGEYFGDYKIEHEDWTKFSPEMAERNKKDTALTVRVYNTVRAEIMRIKEADRKIMLAYLDAEHAVAQFQARAERRGFPFWKQRALRLEKVLAIKLARITDKLEAQLGWKCIAVDKKNGEVEAKVPKWKANGSYHSHTAAWFGVDPWSGFVGEERLIEGPYSRVEFEPLKLSSVSDVKTFLYRHGWQPTDWNTKVDEVTRKKIRTSPKIVEEDLEILGPEGKLYEKYLTYKSRLGILQGWIEASRWSDELDCWVVHGDSMGVGTPSLRMRHQVIANLPTPNVEYGTQLRQLFRTIPGWDFISTDSSGNQLRGLAHFMQNDVFTKNLLEGDIHQFNADLYTRALGKMGIDHIVTRSQAKRIVYAFLFGASGGKLWFYIFNKADDEQGREFKKLLEKELTGFEPLRDSLMKQYMSSKKATGYGFIRGLGGVKIYLDSSHTALVYLLQATEKMTCACGVMLACQRLEAAGIKYHPLIMYHDEFNILVEHKNTAVGREICQQAFTDGPKLVGVQIMSGEAKVGKDWSIH
jgi:DNA polymerase-1